MTWSLAKVPKDPKGGTRPAPLLVDPQCVISTRNSTTPIPLGTPKDPVVCHSFPHSAHHLSASLFNLRMKKITAKPGSCQPATMFQWNVGLQLWGIPLKIAMNHWIWMFCLKKPGSAGNQPLWGISKHLSEPFSGTPWAPQRNSLLWLSRVVSSHHLTEIP